MNKKAVGWKDVQSHRAGDVDLNGVYLLYVWRVLKKVSCSAG
jgi:hypothetical protein